MDIRTVRPATKRMRTAAIATAALLIALFALPQTAFGMQIFAQTPNSKHITLEVEPTDRIEDVREQISGREGYASDRFYLVFAGKVLEDSLTLQDYSIQKDATLRIVLKPTLELGVAADTDLTDGLDAGELVLTAVTASGGAEALTDQAIYSFRSDGAADGSWESGFPVAPGTYEVRALVPVALAASDEVIESLEVCTRVTIPDTAEVPGGGGDSGSTEPGTGSEGSGGSGSVDTGTGAGSGTPGSDAGGSPEAPESGNGQAGTERDDADAGRTGASAAQLPATGDAMPTVLIVLITVAAVAIVAGIVLRSRKR